MACPRLYVLLGFLTRDLASLKTFDGVQVLFFQGHRFDFRFLGHHGCGLPRGSDYSQEVRWYRTGQAFGA